MLIYNCRTVQFWSQEKVLSATCYPSFNVFKLFYSLFKKAVLDYQALDLFIYAL